MEIDARSMQIHGNPPQIKKKTDLTKNEDVPSIDTHRAIVVSHWFNECMRPSVRVRGCPDHSCDASYSVQAVRSVYGVAWADKSHAVYSHRIPGASLAVRDMYYYYHYYYYYYYDYYDYYHDYYYY